MSSTCDPPTSAEYFSNEVIISDRSSSTPLCEPGWVDISENWNRLDYLRRPCVWAICETTTEYKMSTSVKAGRAYKYIVGVTEPKLSFDPELCDEETTSAEPLIEDVLDFIAFKEIILSSRDDVLKYLLKYQDMIELLPDICSKAVEKFGLGSKFWLTVYIAKDIDDEFLELIVRKKQYDEDTIKLIDELQVAFEEEFNRREGWLVVSTDFKTI